MSRARAATGDTLTVAQLRKSTRPRSACKYAKTPTRSTAAMVSNNFPIMVCAVPATERWVGCRPSHRIADLRCRAAMFRQTCPAITRPAAICGTAASNRTHPKVSSSFASLAAPFFAKVYPVTSASPGVASSFICSKQYRGQAHAQSLTNRVHAQAASQPGTSARVWIALAVAFAPPTMRVHTGRSMQSTVVLHAALTKTCQKNERNAAGFKL